MSMEFTYLEHLQTYRDLTDSRIWYTQTDELIEPLGVVAEAEMLEYCKKLGWKFVGVVLVRTSSGAYRLTWIFIREVVVG
jgi:hypothetical protein